jgi:hypothetical protein
MNAFVGRILTTLAVYSVLAPMSSGHCGHWVTNYPECETLEFVFCDGNFTQCGPAEAERLAGNCTTETCDPMADDVIMALNGTDHEGHEGNHTEDSATSAGIGGLETVSIAVSAIGVVGLLVMSI